MLIRHLALALYEAMKEEQALARRLEEAGPDERPELRDRLDRARRELAELRRQMELRKSD